MCSTSLTEATLNFQFNFISRIMTHYAIYRTVQHNFRTINATNVDNKCDFVKQCYRFMCSTLLTEATLNFQYNFMSRIFFLYITGQQKFRKTNAINVDKIKVTLLNSVISPALQLSVEHRQ